MNYTMHFLAVGTILFALGLVGFLARRNLIIIFLCTEIMFQGVILTLTGFALKHLAPDRTPDAGGQAFGLFLLVVAAAEAALALALVVLLFRRRGTLDADKFAMLNG